MLKSNYIKYIAMFVILVLLQVLVLNRISLFGYATPFLYIYFIIKMPIGINRSVITLIGFLMGLTIDIFCNTPGVNAAATACAGFICGSIQGLFILKNDYNDQEPGWSQLGAAFVKYALLLTFIHHLLLISIETFSFFNIKLITLRILSSTILTFLLIFALEGFSRKDKKTWQKTTI